MTGPEDQRCKPRCDAMGMRHSQITEKYECPKCGSFYTEIQMVVLGLVGVVGSDTIAKVQAELKAAGVEP